jgi:DNA polymerase III subunit epsilon
MKPPAGPRGGWAPLVAAAAPALAFAGLLALAIGLPVATLAPEARAALWQLVEQAFALVIMVWAFASLAAGVLARRLWATHAAAPGRIAEQLYVALAATDAKALPEHGSAGSVALAQAANALLAERTRLREDIAARVAEASREVDTERGRLAALMAELTQSVVVCNLDGRVLLFNARARLQFRALQSAGLSSGIGGEGASQGIGLGRSIYGVFDRRLVAHALEAVQQRLARGAANPSAQFVTATQGGQLLRVQLAPVREPGAADDAPLNGFVLMLDNITREMAAERERAALLASLTEGSRGSIGNLRAAVELLDDADLDVATRERFLGVIRDEIGALARRLDAAAGEGAGAAAARWPMEDMLGSDLLAAALRRIEAETGCRGALAEVDAALWLKVESFSVIELLVFLAQRLHTEYDVPRVQLALAPHNASHGTTDGSRARLVVAFPVQAMSNETVVGWQNEPLPGMAGATTTLRDVVERHDGAFWFERERARGEGRLVLLLPLAGDTAPLEAAAVVRHDSRPEFYDFNLFAARGGEHDDLLARPLAELSFTVFDTETTGLEPSAGDKIIQIGAIRIVAGRLRRQDTFEQLVDPARSLPAEGIAIHGITPEMLVGQPKIEQVLPAFHRFVEGSVLVAHNAAFDMRFLELERERCGVQFDMPVLDTLLLSTVLHPQQESHRLEAIAERLGVAVLGRHTALGDALVTAEVFLKMLPLLQAAGLRTLGEVLEASRRSYLARVSY